MSEAAGFVSTRGSGPVVSLADALRLGLAEDGGLFMPTRIPELEVDALPSDSFPELSAEVLNRWVGDAIGREELEKIIWDALDFNIELNALGSHNDRFVLELFHGPTLSFKDFGARVMARLLAHFNREREMDITILVATSGDTGSAVADGFSGTPGARIVLLYPGEKVSPTQEKQLIVARKNVFPLKVEGDFDDCQRLVKHAFRDNRLRNLRLSTANSINIGRLLPQMLYYIWAQRLLNRSDITFCVPSGNLGNLTAGMLAARSGMPTAGFVAAHNANRFFPDFLAGKTVSAQPTVNTLSNAMDVGAPSNFERLLSMHSEDDLRDLIWGTSVSDEETMNRIGATLESSGYLADPHTAVGLEAMHRYIDEIDTDGPCVVLGTAHPAKFPDTVERATGVDPPIPPQLSRLEKRPKSFEQMQPDTDAFAHYLLNV